MSGFSRTVECTEVSPAVQVVVQGECGTRHGLVSCDEAERVRLRVPGLITVGEKDEKGWEYGTPCTVCRARLKRKTGDTQLDPHDLPEFRAVRCIKAYFA